MNIILLKIIVFFTVTVLVESISIPLSPRLVKRESELLSSDNEHLWYGTISVGTPAKEFKVVFDTGSPDLFLPGPACNLNCSGHSVYNTDDSSTSTDLGKPFNLTYGDGSSAIGEQYTDTVSIAGLTATGQTLGVASQYSKELAIDQFQADGILGMSFQEISEFGASPVMQTLIAQGQCKDSTFGFKLAPTGSELFLCGTNNAFYTGPFSWVPVIKKGYWEVNLDSINVNTSQPVKNINVIVDTGATLIILNPKDVANIYNTIPGAKDASSTAGDGYWTVPCNSIPNITLTFGGASFPIDPKEFNLGQVSAGSSDCVGGIKADDSDTPIIGTIFLQHVYTAFDIGNTRVGFAKLS